MERFSVWIIILILFVSFGACSQTESVVRTEPTMKSAIQKDTQPPEEFIIGPEDVLDIVVWKETQLSTVATVRPDGKISLPLIGDIQAAGLTPVALQMDIAKRLREFKQSPEVSVIVQQVNSYNVYVIGEVIHPGKYRLNSPITVLQAISVAGGFTTFASQNIKVLRTEGRNPQQRIIKLRYKDLVSEGGITKNFMLRPGDTVIAP
jgi:polysaccharide export outer membrane protein